MSRPRIEIERELEREVDGLRTTFKDLCDRVTRNEEVISNVWYAGDIQKLYSKCSKLRHIDPQDQDETTRRWFLDCYEQLEEITIRCAEYKAAYAQCVYALLRIMRKCRNGGYSKREMYKMQEERLVGLKKDTKAKIRAIKSTIIEAQQKLQEIRPWIIPQC
ncbi:hypothetical protein TWF703_001744 [Orbilia oligospora]|uniref:Uncharacterized protein n=1 Tax=Orbilia oligospora TaxID=2813651 RepID=A0A7C8P1U6_ORBOL|nr:hypothetical protein TWF703_001744 [Orbilia oligospora]